MADKIKLAIVGCGRISASHFDAIRECRDQIELVSVCDVDLDRAREIGRKHDAPSFDNLNELLLKSNPDLVSICTPSGLHAEQSIACLDAGKHVIAEKPMATRFADGIRMVEAADRARKRLFVVKQNRKNPTLRLLKQAIDENRFGRIYMATVNVFWCRPQSYYDQAPWRGTWALDGGALMNQASHYVDMLDWLLGPIESVHAYTATLARKIESEDSAVMHIRWRSGALGSLNVTMLTYKQNLEGSITVIGENGTVRVGGVAVNQIQHWEFKEPRPEDAQIASVNYETSSVYGKGHLAYYQNVLACLKDKRLSETEGREGLKSLEVLIASYLSARDGRPVGLPLTLG